MKKLAVLLGLGLFLSSALYAADKSGTQQTTHMGDHMHEGKMTNHMNMNGMTNEDMKRMHNSMHKMNTDNLSKKESPVYEKYQELLNSKNAGDGRDINF